jgi:hypothetical protein
VGAVTETLAAQSITRVLYPDDSTAIGQELRFLQEYFLCACATHDIIRQFRAKHQDWNLLPEKVAVQLNDTHPTVGIAELMRILLDDAGLGWDQAWSITQRVFAYTNHTLLPEALERWPVSWFEDILPRHLEIIHEINHRFLDEVRGRYPGDEARVARMSLIEEGPVKKVRMANLAIVGSHSTNGVAAIHTGLLKSHVVPDFAEMFPERFNNKTNGVTPRRWLLVANPPLARVITEAIGDGWIGDLSQIARLKPLADDPQFRAAFREAKRAAKLRFLDWMRSATGETADPDSIFDSQIKRIHEYKRQLLNALHIVILYNRLRKNTDPEAPARTFFFAGKAAPAYHLAKLIIKFINNLAAVIDQDTASQGKLKVIFLPDYGVSVAERLIPASDVSEQISTAGYEASGTSNMKFMMNGALTIGTRDGATVEMAEEAGEENMFLFGLSAAQVSATRQWYNPYWHYENEPETRAALDRSLPVILVPASRACSNRSSMCFSRTGIFIYISPTCGLTATRIHGSASFTAIRRPGIVRRSSTSRTQASSPATGPSRSTQLRSGISFRARRSRIRGLRNNHPESGVTMDYDVILTLHLQTHPQVTPAGAVPYLRELIRKGGGGCVGRSSFARAIEGRGGALLCRSGGWLRPRSPRWEFWRCGWRKAGPWLPGTCRRTACSKSRLAAGPSGRRADRIGRASGSRRRSDSGSNPRCRPGRVSRRFRRIRSA